MAVNFPMLGQLRQTVSVWQWSGDILSRNILSEDIYCQDFWSAYQKKRIETVPENHNFYARGKKQKINHINLLLSKFCKSVFFCDILLEYLFASPR